MQDNGVDLLFNRQVCASVLHLKFQPTLIEIICEHCAFTWISLMMLFERTSGFLVKVHALQAFLVVLQFM